VVELFPKDQTLPVKRKEFKSTEAALGYLEGIIDATANYDLKIRGHDNTLIDGISSRLNERAVAGEIYFNIGSSWSAVGVAKGAAIGAVAGGVIGAVAGGVALCVGAAATVLVAGVACPIIVVAIVGGILIGTLIGAPIGGRVASRIARITVDSAGGAVTFNSEVVAAPAAK